MQQVVPTVDAVGATLPDGVAKDDELESGDYTVAPSVVDRRIELQRRHGTSKVGGDVGLCFTEIGLISS